MRYVLRLSRVMLCNFGVVAEGSPPSLIPLPLIPPPLRPNPPLVDNDDIPPASMLDDDDLPTTVDATVEDEDAVGAEDEDVDEDEDEDEDPEDVLERPSSSPTTDIAVSPPPNETSWLMEVVVVSNRIKVFFFKANRLIVPKLS